MLAAVGWGRGRWIGSGGGNEGSYHSASLSVEIELLWRGGHCADLSVLKHMPRDESFIGNK